MARPANYNTKQREMILNCIASFRGVHMTAAKIFEYLKKEGLHIGRTTIYRHLEKLTESGKIFRYANDDESGICYHYVGDGKHNGGDGRYVHVHFKCETCGELLHLDCDVLDEIKQHFCDMNTFVINDYKLVIYGKCERCCQTNSNF